MIGGGGAEAGAGNGNEMATGGRRGTGEREQTKEETREMRGTRTGWYPSQLLWTQKLGRFTRAR